MIQRTPRSDVSKHSSDESKNMYRLRLGKTTTEFFSERGNNRLKRIWLDNDLDEEMIFSSWIGVTPSQALIRQKVSDYIQAFLLRRSQHVPFRDGGMLLLLRRFSVDCDLELKTDEKGKHEYYNTFVHSALKKRCEEREKAERLRIEKCIANNDLPVLPGFEHVSQHPIFRVDQLQKRMKYLSKIPFPYNQHDFETHVLPIMTALAVEEENIKEEKGNLHRKKLSRGQSFDQVASKSTDLTDDSGVMSDSSIQPDTDTENDTVDFDTELVQIFSEMEIKSSDLTSLDDTLGDVCEVCGGLFDCKVNEGMACTCMSDSNWNGSRCQTALSMFEDASKIVHLHTMKHVFCKDYMDQYYSNSWTK